ncbi:MAG TPA: helicase C-terminal domain-containing protein, partial [Dehalococcoidia bacterium]|nr:helicase C-terminal domain-containing protein [Dehalococcoidia bacterium]
WRGFFREAWDLKIAQGAAPDRPFRVEPPASPGPIVRQDGARPRPVPLDEPLGVLASARERPDVLPQFEERAEQQAMVRAVTEALNEGRRLLVEAGTGTGKSLAYLIPAACQALAGGRRVVVSTATINLQEQLTGKDVPALQALLPTSRPLAACQLKGRRNYLCLRRFADLRSAPALSDDEARLASRVLIWLTQTQSGDRAELRLSQGEDALWRRLSADGAGCTLENSPFVVEGTCFLHRARRRAESSHIVIVNHALLLSDIAAEGRVLPPYDHLIVDEAHHLEEEATRQFGFACREADLADLQSRCEGLAPALQAVARGRGAALSPASPLAGFADALRGAAGAVRPRLREVSRQLVGFLKEQAPEPQEPRLLLNRSARVQPDWANVEIAWENLRLTLQDVGSRLERLQAALGDAEGLGIANYEMLCADVAAVLQDVQGVVAGLAAGIEEDDPERVVWLEQDRGQGGFLLAWAPLRVDQLLRERLYADRTGVVLTGATLTSPDRQGRGSFAYLQDRLGLREDEKAEVRTLALGSPFDFERAALVLVPRDMPEPTWPDYLEALSRAIAALARASAGRALVLFTSHATLRAAHALVRDPLQPDGIEVLGQGIDGSPRHLVRTLLANPRSVVLGTASFWEGVDLAGEALSLLVMARLPFTVPTEPVFAARSALYDDPFGEYALPQAVLRFKQGFGRLIRSKTDRGVLVVLDRRIVSKSYGSAFLGSLPPCPVREAMLREMPGLVREWLAPVAAARETGL